MQPRAQQLANIWVIQTSVLLILVTVTSNLLYTSVSQPPGPGINYTGLREAWGNYNMLQDFISPVDK